MADQERRGADARGVPETGADLIPPKRKKRLSLRALRGRTVPLPGSRRRPEMSSQFCTFTLYMLLFVECGQAFRRELRPV